jgi:Carboxypeptidase regulatory-like domain
MSPLQSRFTITLCSLLSVSTLAFGQNASIEANLKGANGHPPKNAQVRIESVGKQTKPVVVKPDTDGHVTVAKLEAGSYRVTAIVDGKVQSSQNVNVEANKPAVVAFKIPNASNTAAVPSGAKTKIVGHMRYVWVPGQTGSRFGGYWKEAGTVDRGQDANGNVVTGDGQTMEQAQRQGRSGAASGSATR